MIIRMTGSNSRIIYEALPSDDPIQRQPDISYAAAQLGWKPKIELEEGLEMTIAYFKEIMGIKL
jgi:UDP-glucuronate decarboxylase